VSSPVDTQPGSGGGEGGNGFWRVLIVEDSHIVAQLHRRLVESTPGFCALEVAPDGESAYRAVTSMRPDLAIVDLSMPGTDGRSFLRRIRQESVPLEVIVVTASRDAATVRETLHLGVVDYLVKPFAPERLQRALGAFAQRARALTRAKLGQDAVDLVQGSGAPRLHPLPKGLKRSTLSAVRSVIASSDRPLSAEEVGREIGVARVTARRYLDYLDVIGAVRVERETRGPGRPLNRYHYVGS
jgi:two-component system, CitB family, response regulator DctR